MLPNVPRIVTFGEKVGSSLLHVHVVSSIYVIDEFADEPLNFFETVALFPTLSETSILITPILHALVFVLKPAVKVMLFVVSVSDIW